MDRLWHLGGPRACSASLEIDCKFSAKVRPRRRGNRPPNWRGFRAEFEPDVYFSRRNHSPSMIPFLHLGPLSIPTYGLMVATGLLVAAYLLQADINRRRAQFIERGYLKSVSKGSYGDEAFLIIGIIGIAGLVGARLYSVLENPRELIANPAVLISRYGFTWSGSVITTLVAMVFLARHFDIPVLEFMDLCAPPAALGYAIGRIGCLLSGDGDYGRPTSWPWPWGMAFPRGVVPTTETCVQWGWPADCRVYPTPIYEFFIWIAIAAFLWHMGKKAAAGERPMGEIFCSYLILTGAARFLIEFIRINPRSFFGLSNAQTASLVSIVAGAMLFWGIRRRFRARKEGDGVTERAD